MATTSQDRTDSFIQAVQARRAAMYHVALSYLKSPADAEDAVSEAIAATWAHLELVRSAEALPAYLMRAVIHACHRTLRKQKREVRTDEAAVFDRPYEEGAPLWEYVSDLPEEYRLPLLMRYGDGLPEQEIAQALRIRRGTVSSRLSRGLKRLRAQLQEEEENE